MGLRIVQQYEIGEHLDRAVGDVTRDEGILEAAVGKAKHDPPIRSLLRGDPGNAGDPLRHRFQYLVEDGTVVFVEILRDERQILALGRKMFGEACVLNGPRRADVKVGDVPVLDEIAKCARRLETLELSQSLDRQNVGRVERLLLAVFLGPLGSDVALVSDGVAGAVLEPDEIVWLATTEFGCISIVPGRR